MNNTIRILYVEDCLEDRELVADTLRREGLQCEFFYAVTREEIRNLLTLGQFDLIFSDFSLPGYSGMEVLALAGSLQPEIPFLFLSGTIGEERAIQTLRSGATDYILKDHLDRFGAAVRRAMREAHERREWHRAEQQLRLFRSLIDHTNDTIEIIDLETGRFLDVNEQACHAHGYSREEYLSLTLPEVTHSLAKLPWQKIVDHLRSRGSVLLKGEHRRKDGSSFPVEVRATYIKLDREYMLAIARDITEREQAEEALRKSEQRFRELADTIDEVFWISTLDRKQLLYISSACEKILGHPCQSLYEEPDLWLKTVHVEDRERVEQALRNLPDADAYEWEYRIIRPDSKVRVIRERAFPVRDLKGNVERLIGVARDITENRILADQLRQSQKMEAIGQLAGGVAHDFNNVLAAIILQAQLSASATGIPETVCEGLQNIRLAAERAANLTRQLLLFSRKQVMQSRNLDLNEAVTSLVKMLQRIIGEDIQLQSRLHPGPLTTHADSGMLDQVLMNLVINSRDAMPAGGELLIETTRTDVDEEMARRYSDISAGPYVCVSVVDTGVGIPKEVLPRIFEPFFTTKEVGKGTGLGLATAFGIVKQHRGFIQIETELGKGSRFQVFLPASDAEPEMLIGMRPPEIQGGCETILVVEDSQAVRSLTQILLERHGYRVLPAADGVEALELWEKHAASISLLMTDLVMPGGLSGQELARKLQRDNPQLKTIFTSGYSAEIGGCKNGLKPGDNFLQKPSPADKLLEIVRRRLDEGKQ
jgi:PAS domain S-box-containing protein